MCPVVGLKAIPLEAWLGGNSERVEAPPFGADLLSPEIYPVDSHFLVDVFHTLILLSSAAVTM
jgi:hypothetical protein